MTAARTALPLRLEPRGALDLMILKALSLGPSHGYAVARWIERRTHQAFTVRDAAVYPALHRLERRGFVRAAWGTSKTKRDARIYGVTALGKRHMASSTAEWKRFTTALAAVLSSRG